MITGKRLRISVLLFFILLLTANFLQATPKTAEPLQNGRTVDEGTALKQIRAFAKEKYPNDHEMEEYVYKEQVEAYKYMQGKDSAVSAFAAEKYLQPPRNYRAKEK